jgi:hypothetical protein
MVEPAITGTLTILLAAFAAMIAYFQWRTAHQRIVLDLFDRRVQVLEDIEEIIRNINRTTDVSNDDMRLFWKARAKAGFLFGPDINDYLMVRLLDDLAWRNTFDDSTINTSQERQELLHKKYEILKRISRFSKEVVPLFEPYMKLDHAFPMAAECRDRNVREQSEPRVGLWIAWLVSAELWAASPTPSSPPAPDAPRPRAGRAVCRRRLRSRPERRGRSRRCCSCPSAPSLRRALFVKSRSRA